VENGESDDGDGGAITAALTRRPRRVIGYNGKLRRVFIRFKRVPRARERSKRSVSPTIRARAVTCCSFRRVETVHSAESRNRRDEQVTDRFSDLYGI